MVDLPVVLNLISTAAIVGGLIFAGVELRASRSQRRHEAQVLLLHSFEGPDLTRSMKAIMSLPDGLSRAEVEARPGDLDQKVWYWLGMMESIGILVFGRDIDLPLVANTIGGPILISHHKLSRYIADVRADLQRDSFDEWFEWLADRVAALEDAEGRIAAHIREADWKP